MKNLPENYAWLCNEPAPKMLIEALKYYGTLEVPGIRNNSTIMSWAKDVGVENIYSGDDVPWCGLFMAVVAKHAGKQVVPNPLWALNWDTFENKSPKAMLGDVLVFRRGTAGHVALYVGEDATAYHCLGGNQSDRVCITRVLKARLYGVRRPAWKISQPSNVRVIQLSDTGLLSSNEK